MTAAPASRALILHAFALCIAFLAGILASEALWAAPTRLADEPVLAAPLPPLEAKPLGDADRQLLDRLKPHLLAAADERLDVRFKTIASDIENYDPNKKQAGFVAIGTILAVAFVALIKKVIAGIIITMAFSIIAGLLWKYWLPTCVVLFIANVVIPFIAGRMGGATARRAA